MSNFDFTVGFIGGVIAWGMHAFYKRMIFHEVWVDKYELERLYKVEDVRKMELQEFNPIVHVTYGCKFCRNETEEQA